MTSERGTGKKGFAGLDSMVSDVDAPALPEASESSPPPPPRPEAAIGEPAPEQPSCSAPASTQGGSGKWWLIGIGFVVLLIWGSGAEKKFPAKTAPSAPLHSYSRPAAPVPDYPPAVPAYIPQGPGVNPEVAAHAPEKPNAQRREKKEAFPDRQKQDQSRERGSVTQQQEIRTPKYDNCPQGSVISSHGTCNTSLPENAVARSYGWECKKGYIKIGDTCALVIVPENASIDQSSSAGWRCTHGYYKLGPSCLQLPPNADAFEGTPFGWRCRNGTKFDQDKCLSVDIPHGAVAAPNSPKGWTCKSSYEQSGDSCSWRGG